MEIPGFINRGRPEESVRVADEVVEWDVGELYHEFALTMHEGARRFASALTGRYDGITALEERDVLLRRDPWGGEV